MVPLSSLARLDGPLCSLTSASAHRNAVTRVHRRRTTQSHVRAGGAARRSRAGAGPRRWRAGERRVSRVRDGADLEGAAARRARGPLDARGGDGTVAGVRAPARGVRATTRTTPMPRHHGPGGDPVLWRLGGVSVVVSSSWMQDNRSCRCPFLREAEPPPAKTR